MKVNENLALMNSEKERNSACAETRTGNITKCCNAISLKKFIGS